VGRRLAFDSGKGRLWAVCSKCGRWNLTPIEERWEAIEECERQYRSTIKRASTDEIGIARLSEGTDLIRIGEPLRPEFAAWRYGRRFRRRRQIMFAAHAISWGTMIGLYATVGSFVFFVPAATLVTTLLSRKSEIERSRRFIVKQAKDNFGRKLNRYETLGVDLIASSESPGWGLRFGLDRKYIEYHGREVLRLARLAAPSVNSEGASQRVIDVAVAEIESVGSPDKYFERLVRFPVEKGWRYTDLRGYPAEMRLAFEMAAHEEAERAAMETDLTQLEADWREAEEVASIADNMFLPESITDFIEKHRPNRST